MANRHSHKKLRAEVRARMTKTGESYQAARQHILTAREPPPVQADLVSFHFFGVEMTLGTAGRGDRHSFVLRRSAFGRARETWPLPFSGILSPKGEN